MATDKKNAEEIKREVAQLKEEIEALKEQARQQGQAISSLDEDQLTKKVRGETSNSPFMYVVLWTSQIHPGNDARYKAYVHNPEPRQIWPVYVTMFFGLGSVFDAASAWVGRDKRWPEFTSDQGVLPANSSHSFIQSYTVPTGPPNGMYHANLVLWSGNFQEVNVVFDRTTFAVKLG